MHLGPITVRAAWDSRTAQSRSYDDPQQPQTNRYTGEHDNDVPEPMQAEMRASEMKHSIGEGDLWRLTI
jgi:hypothetical protein